MNRERYSLKDVVAEMEFTLADIQVDAFRRFMDGLDAPQPAFASKLEVDIDWGCCDEPDPRVHNATGRFFCANCRRWLDRREEVPPPDEDA